mgnify:CR=1 FL=1
MPDHGFVWSRPWEVLRADSQSAELRVSVPEYDCVLTRRVRVGDAVSLDYVLETSSGVPMPFVWAGHCLFAVGLDLAVAMRAPVARVDSSFGVEPDEPWPHDGDLYRWEDAAVGGYVKWFAPWPRRGVVARWGSRALRLDAQADASLPLTLGMWVNREAFPGGRPVSHLGLEPTIGDADDLTVAVDRGSCGWVSPDAPAHWSVTLTPRPAVESVPLNGRRNLVVVAKG